MGYAEEQQELQTRLLDDAKQIATRLQIVGGQIAGLSEEYRFLLASLPDVRTCRNCREIGAIMERINTPSKDGGTHDETKRKPCPACGGLVTERCIELFRIRLPRPVQIRSSND